MNFDLQPFQLQNELIQLVPLQETDFEELYSVANDQLLWEQHPNRDRYKREVFQNFFQGAMQSKGAFFVRDAKTNEPIGSSRYYDYNPETNSVLSRLHLHRKKILGKRLQQSIEKSDDGLCLPICRHNLFSCWCHQFPVPKSSRKTWRNKN